MIDAKQKDIKQTRGNRPNSYPRYEFKASTLTNNHPHGTKKEAEFSYNQGNFFGLLTDLTQNDPELTFECVTSDKKSVYSLTLKHSDLQAKSK